MPSARSSLAKRAANASCSSAAATRDVGVLALLDHALGRCDRERALRRDRLARRERRGRAAPRREHAVGEPDAQRLLGVDRLAGRARSPSPTRARRGARAGSCRRNPAGCRDSPRAGRSGPSGSRRSSRTPARARSRRRAHSRSPPRSSESRATRAPRSAVAEPAEGARLGGAHRRHRRDVGAGGERAALAGQHERARARVGRRRADARLELRERRGVERVQRLRAGSVSAAHRAAPFAHEFGTGRTLQKVPADDEQRNAARAASRRSPRAALRACPSSPRVRAAVLGSSGRPGIRCSAQDRRAGRLPAVLVFCSAGLLTGLLALLFGLLALYDHAPRTGRAAAGSRGAHATGARSSRGPRARRGDPAGCRPSTTSRPIPADPPAFARSPTGPRHELPA